MLRKKSNALENTRAYYKRFQFAVLYVKINGFNIPTTLCENKWFQYPINASLQKG